MILKSILFSYKPIENKNIIIKDNEFSINYIGKKDYDIYEIKKAVKIFGITKTPVEEIFSNKHTARAILVHVLRDGLVGTWKVKQGNGTSLLLCKDNNEEYEFHVIEHVVDEKNSCAYLKEDIEFNNIKGYFLADIRDLQKVDSDKRFREVAFYEFYLPITLVNS